MESTQKAVTKQPALKINQLTVNYEKTPVLWDVSLEVPTGKLVGIIGPNGAGKSTLLKAVLGLVKPLSGKVEFFGCPLEKIRQKIAYVPQRESVDWDFPITVRDLVLMGRYGRLNLFRRPSAADYSAVEHYLKTVGIHHLADRQISQLSGGQQQRAFLARALIQEADLYFMDEPFTAIDASTEAILVNVLKQLQEKGKTVFVVHHNLNSVESYFDWAILLNLRLVANGDIEKVFTPKFLGITYGKSYELFDEALKLSQEKNKGIQ